MPNQTCTNPEPMDGIHYGYCRNCRGMLVPNNAAETDDPDSRLVMVHPPQTTTSTVSPDATSNASTTTHTLKVVYDHDCLRASIVCTAPATDACRWEPSCECERYTPEKDDQGWYHNALVWPVPDGEDEEQRHRHRPINGCSYEPWWDAAEECGPGGDPVTLAEVPVKVEWDDEFYRWEPADA